jgi:hypothetical protein
VHKRCGEIRKMRAAIVDVMRNERWPGGTLYLARY